MFVTDNPLPGENHYQELRETLQQRPVHWLVTGAAGFIGSNLVLTLLQLGQRVRGLDNFLTGHRHNLTQIAQIVGAAAWRNFDFIEGDIRDLPTCRQACQGVDVVLHQAALGSVARSLQAPLTCHTINVSGFLNMLEACRLEQVSRLVYASSSATYGDHATLPKQEASIGKPLSPYALSKQIDELYADLYQRCYGLHSIGLRYFNVFGPRQDPCGAYAAVIPGWIAALQQGRAITIYGDGETSRDFCFVENVVQANLLAALTDQQEALDQVYNIAVAGRTTLNQLYDMLQRLLLAEYPHVADVLPRRAEFRAGDVRHSHADISKAQRLLQYRPTHDLQRGLQQTVHWYNQHQLAPQAK